MIVVSIAVAVVAVTFVAIAAFLIPAIVEIRKTSAAARSLIVSTEEELRPALKELRQTLQQVREVTDTAGKNLQEVDGFFSALGETGRVIRSLNSGISGIGGLFDKSNMFATFAAAAGQFFFDRIKKRRKRGHGE